MCECGVRIALLMFVLLVLGLKLVELVLRVWCAIALLKS